MKFLSSVQPLELSVGRRGFTLVEMMVVISIIGILVAILYANFNQARMQARDKIRQAQLQQLQVSLEQYKDRYGRYPARGCVGLGNQGVAPWWSGPVSAASWNSLCADYIVGHAAGINFVPDFIEKLPRDPLETTAAGGKGIFYQTNGSGSNYKVVHHLNVETLFVSAIGDPFYRIGAGCAFSSHPNTYAIYSAGAECW